MLVITSLIILFSGGCKKDETSATNSQELILKQINQYIPDVDAKTKVKMLNAFREKAVAKESNQLKSATDFEDTPADLARYLIETTLNTDYANVYDSTLTNYTNSTVEIVVSNNGMTDEGFPILNGESLTNAFLDLKQAAEELNTETTTFYFATVQLAAYDESSTTIQATMGSADGYYDPYVHVPIVLKPWENPVPFNSNESYYPVSDYPYPPYTITNPNPNWAGAKIEAKLNAHYEAIYSQPGPGIIMERINPDVQITFLSDCSGNTIWGGYYNYIPLNYIQLNYYLNSYKAYMDAVNYPYGYNDTYVMHAYVYHYDQLENSYPPSPAICDDNYNSYTDWHYLVFKKMKFTRIGDPNGE